MLLFSLFVLMSFGVVLLLSIPYIRKTMGPLESLKEGTNRILKGDFETMVEVKTGDEIGRATSSALNIQFLVDTVLCLDTPIGHGIDLEWAQMPLSDSILNILRTTVKGTKKGS